MCASIGQLSSTLWFAEFLKCVTESYAPYHVLMLSPSAIKSIQPALNEAFVAFSEDIMTD